MASEDAPDNANAAVSREETAVDEKNVAGEAEPKTFLKGKRRSEQEAQGKGGKQKGQLPRKRFFRARAHSNPLSDCQFAVPTMPSEFDWSESFSEFFSREEVAEGKDLKVRFADIGCGFGGLIVQMSPLFPESLMVGMELRDKVSEYVKERITALREQHPGQYKNISVLRTNAMKYLPNYFEKGQLQKMFFLFPDPHFKEKNHRRRIISTALLAEYAYIMAVGGILYTVTDVQELGEWMKTTLDAHPLFQPLTDEEMEKDVCIPLLTTATEEGQKVERNGGSTYKAIYRRIAGPKNSGA